MILNNTGLALISTVAIDTLSSAAQAIQTLGTQPIAVLSGRS